MARKITEDSVRAFLNDQKFQRSNTSVSPAGNGYPTTLFYQGNAIMKKEGGIFICQGWWKMSMTTKERLNGLMDALNLSRIFQRKGIIHINDVEWDDPEQWTNVYTNHRLEPIENLPLNELPKRWQKLAQNVFKDTSAAEEIFNYANRRNLKRIAHWAKQWVEYDPSSRMS